MISYRHIIYKNSLKLKIRYQVYIHNLDKIQISTYIFIPYIIITNVIDLVLIILAFCFLSTGLINYNV